MARAPVASVAPTAMEPSAPALETAAAMAGVETPAMGAWTMGWDRPSDSMIDMGRLLELCGRRALGRITSGYPTFAFRLLSRHLYCPKCKKLCRHSDRAPLPTSPPRQRAADTVASAMVTTHFPSLQLSPIDVAIH